MIAIKNITNNEWLNYREDLIDDFYARGYVLKPTVGCSDCDIGEDYTCFACECNQLEAIL